MEGDSSDFANSSSNGTSEKKIHRGTGNGISNFSSFDQFDIGFDNICIAGGVPFEIPSLPSSPFSDENSNVHMAGAVPFEIPPLSDFSSLDIPVDDSSLIKSSSRTEAILLSSTGNGGALGTQSLQASYQTTRDCSTSKSVSISGETSIPFSCLDNQDQNSEATLFQVPESDHVSWNTSSFTAFDAHNSVGGGNDEDACKEKPLSFSGSQGHILGHTFPHMPLPSKEVDDEFGDISINQVTDHVEEFGDFLSSASGIMASRTEREDGDFGDFSSVGNLVTTTTAAVAATSISGAALTTTSDGSRTATVQNDAPEEDFGEFSTYSQPVATMDGFIAKIPNSIATTASTAAEKSGDDEFGGFSVSNSTIPENDFGGFGVFPRVIAPVSKTAAVDDDFEAFQDNPAAIINAGMAEGDFGELGGFSSSTSTTTAATTTLATTTLATEDDFGEFFGETKTKGDDDFGEFGDFSSTASTAAVVFSSAAPSQTIIAQPSKDHLDKPAVEVLNECFVGTVKAKKLSTEGSSSLQTLAKLLAAEKGKNLTSVWLALQRCIDLTVPLHKFDSSHLQDSYHTCLRVDPNVYNGEKMHICMQYLDTKPTTLSVLTGMAKFEDPLGGTTAVEELRESFGFECDLPELGSQIIPAKNTTSGFRKESEEQSAALLDLSLPLSPKQEPGEQSFTLTNDLAGLDLNLQSKLRKSKRLTSIEELLLNEQLVVNCSTWMDSQLADLGGDEGEASQDKQKNLRPNTPRSANMTVELQLQELGLDVSKTTLPKTSKNELSLSTRSVLGRLPDLSFMLLTDRIEDRTNYSRGYLHN